MQRFVKMEVLEDGGDMVRLACPCGVRFVSSPCGEENCWWDEEARCLLPRCPGCGAVSGKAASPPTKKVYEGRITPDGGKVTVTGPSGNGRPLDPRLDLRNHSPTGLAWGYGGSGPAQLALAILADLLEDDERAQALYQNFKWKVIARLPQSADWLLTGEGILAAIEEIEADRRFHHWLSYEAPAALGVDGRRGNAILLRTDPAGRRVLLDAEGFFAPRWVAVPDDVPVPALSGEDHGFEADHAEEVAR